MWYFRPSKRAELGFRWRFSLVISDQLEATNYNPLFRPKSGEIRYLTGPEITHPGTGLANFISFYGTEECRVEGDVNVSERNCSETGLGFDWLQFSFSLFSIFLDHCDDPHLDVLKGHLRHKGLNVNFLHLEEVEHIGEEAGRA